MLSTSPEKLRNTRKSDIRQNTIFDIKENSVLNSTNLFDEFDQNAYSNPTYDSPSINQSINPHFLTILSEPDHNLSLYSSTTITNTNFDYIQNSTESSISSDEIFICCLSHEASSKHELSIEFTDRLRLLRNSDLRKDSYFVQNLLSNECGLVPKHCICSLDQFLRDIKLLKC